MRSKVFAILALAAGLASTASAQVTVGVPTAGEGNCVPIGCSNLGFLRYQQAYNASAFSGPMNIGSFSFFHRQLQPGQGSYADGTYNFYFTTTTKTPNTLNSNPLGNFTSGSPQFFATVVLLNASAVSPLFTVTGTPYNYDPSLGNLLMDVRMVYGAGGPLVFNDVDRSGSGAVGRYYGGMTSGATDNLGLVTQFDSAPSTVPEPSSIILVAAGLAGVVAFSRRRNRA